MKKYLENSKSEIESHLKKNNIKFDDVFVEVSSYITIDGYLAHSMSANIDGWTIDTMEDRFIRTQQLDHELIDTIKFMISEHIQNFSQIDINQPELDF